jgi:hypothetical protein
VLDEMLLILRQLLPVCHIVREVDLLPRNIICTPHAPRITALLLDLFGISEIQYISLSLSLSLSLSPSLLPALASPSLAC